MARLDADRARARLAVVEEHVRCENLHDVNAVMATFGGSARYDDEPWNDRRAGHDGVRSYYTELMRALPDLSIEIVHRHAGTESVVLEVIIGERNADRGAASLPRAEGSSFPSAGSSHSTRMTVWQASGSSTTARWCSASWVYSTSPCEVSDAWSRHSHTR
jgi:hypothetical protein